MKVYLVIRDHGGEHQDVIAVMAHEEEAVDFVRTLSDMNYVYIVERTLIYGQPSVRGYNP